MMNSGSPFRSTCMGVIIIEDMHTIEMSIAKTCAPYSQSVSAFKSLHLAILAVHVRIMHYT